MNKPNYEVAMTPFEKKMKNQRTCKSVASQVKRSSNKQKLKIIKRKVFSLNKPQKEFKGTIHRVVMPYVLNPFAQRKVKMRDHYGYGSQNFQDIDCVKKQLNFKQAIDNLNKILHCQS